ncbi:hypothetical protein DERF_010755 [Dermatophagoides farinae]|uniref:Uncharacterized protein n=1 Tax=Dermatophagoides farinae TaxID=6954 RepID=A0A922HRH0_DERFA|nr:hypothetical protein DERF_010755 [Dermatophagoides farinae]
MVIKIFSVRLFHYFYSSIGFSFGCLDWKHRWSIIKCIIMNILFINAIYHIMDYKNHEFTGLNDTAFNQKIFGRFIDNISASLYIGSFFVSYLIYSFNGHDLIKLADSSIFKKIYSNDSKNFIVSLVILIMTILDNLIMHYYFGDWTGRFEEILESLKNLIKFYMNIMMFFEKILAKLMFYYFKNAIQRLLQRIECQFKSNEITEIECMNNIRELAQISMKFHFKAGYLTLILIIEYICELMYIMLKIQMQSTNMIQSALMIFNISFIFYLVWMDNQIQQTLLNIIKHLSHRNDRRQQNFKIQSARSMDRLLALLDRQRQNSMDNGQLWPLFDQIGAIWMMKIRPKSRNQIRYFEMIHLYQEYFRMNLHDLIVYDTRFLLSLNIFAASYFVLLTQTEN